MTLPDYRQRVEALLGNVGTPASCKGCGAPIRWVRHSNGKNAPYDAVGDSIGVNHFATCNRAADFHHGRAHE